MANNLSIQYCNVSQGQDYPQLDAEAQTTTYTGHALAHSCRPGSNAKISVLNKPVCHQKGRLPRVGSEVAPAPTKRFPQQRVLQLDGHGRSGASGQAGFNNFQSTISTWLAAGAAAGRAIQL